MEKKAFVVVGLGFGDEGKGLATDYLSSHSMNPLVIRFNGGHQAGHTVVTKEGKRHVFSCFGSGTFRNASTYWSNYCTFSLSMMLMEYKELLAMDVRPNLLIDLLCPVTTHYDILYNRLLEDSRGHSRHGSCGLGFGVTLERHELPHLKLHVKDLLHSEVFIPKLHAIRAYYEEKINDETKYLFNEFDHDLEDQKFISCVKELSILSAQEIIRFVHEYEIFTSHTLWSTYIFEGAQGVLLDMDFGTWPHVTRSNTTSKNALELLNRYIKNSFDVEIFYVTRCYQTKHGAGPFQKAENIALINNEYETNQNNNYQGDFQIGYLNIDLLNYALKCDDCYSVGLKKHLLITCLDQLKSDYLEYFHDSLIKKIHYMAIASLLDYSFLSQYFSFSPCSENIKTTEYLKT